LLNGCSISNKEDEKVLEMENGDGCTTMWMYLMPMNYALKMMKMDNFMLYIFYYNINKIRKIVLQYYFQV
jgi:hypothetical protein